jgi:hypothetical protein
MKLLRIPLIAAAVLLTAVAGHAEAGKGFSRITTGEVLWGMFIFGLAIPVSLGSAVFGLLQLRRTAKPGVAATVLPAVVGWWLGVLLLFQNPRDFSWWMLLAAAVVPATIIGLLTSRETGEEASEHSPPDREKL